MKPDQERVKTLLSQTVTLLCKNGLHYEKELRIQGLLGITIDCESVFIVHFNESLSDFTSDVVSPLLTGATSVEGCAEKTERSRSAAISAGKPSTLCSETDAEKSCGSLDEIRKPSPLHESGNLQSENVEAPLSLDEDLKTVKTEQNSEEDGDDVVLVESENEQDIGTLAGTLFPTSNESVESRVKRDRRHRLHLPPVAHSSKRRRLALPAPMENAAVYDDGGGSNYNVKMEPLSSDYLGSGEQNLPYDEGYPEHSWDNSKTIFYPADPVEDLTSVPGCSSWDGFDLQARGSTTSGAMPRSNELYHESASASALPLSNLTNPQMRQSLTQRFVIPLVYDAHRPVCAFRVLWRSPGSALESAWNNVGLHKETCDRIVAGISDVDFFFTAASGHYNKNKRQVDPRTCVVYPAVSYYAVLKSRGDILAVVNSVRAQVNGNFRDVEVKAILRHCPGFCGNLADLAAPLFVVLKDYNSSFVRNRVDEGLAVMGRLQEQTNYFTVKLVVVNPDFNESVSNAYDALLKDTPVLRTYITFVPAKN